MIATAPFRPGAPGLYVVPPLASRALTGVPMDVAAFVGVAPRGPARVPVVNEQFPADEPLISSIRPRIRTVAVAVESFDEYRRTFGGFEGAGLLPYAVATFFDQGGRRAYIARIVHDYGADSAFNLARVARGVVPWSRPDSPLAFPLLARNEGRWGNSLRSAFGVVRRPLAFDVNSATANGFTLPPDTDLPDGSAVQVTFASGDSQRRYLEVREERLPNRGGTQLRVRFDQPTVAVPHFIDVIEGELLIDDGTREERLTRLGLTPEHSRWIARVVDAESELVFADAGFTDPFNVNDLDFTRSARLDVQRDVDPATRQFSGGDDGSADIVPEDFFDSNWVLGNDEPGVGVHCLVLLEDLSIVCAPDLYSPGPIAETDDVRDPGSFAGAAFTRCVHRPLGDQSQSAAELNGLRLDPRLPGELQQIIALQQRLEDLAETLRSFVVLLDVPPGLTQRQVVRWRSSFDSSFAAAYHPWLKVARPDDARDALIQIPPSACAAGAIAAKELTNGVPFGPANVIVAGAVDVAAQISSPQHDELHPIGINVFLPERDGIRLTAARTLSRDSDYRQLSVRRLMTQLKRSLERETQWIVFEPNNTSLRNDVRRMLEAYLGRLYRSGALRGATEEDAFFVRIDDSRQRSDAGQLFVEIGVAPAEPLEFLLLRLISDADGTTVSEA